MSCCGLFEQFLFFLALTGLVFPNAAARASPESGIFCSPLIVEPNQKSYCVVSLRGLQEDPKTVFRLEGLSVTAHAIIPSAVVYVSPLRRGDDETTAMFEVSASEGTNIRVEIMYTLGARRFSIRDNSLTLLVLFSPATRMGPITCNIAPNGLELRSTATCRAVLYDVKNRFAVVHENEVVFSEERGLGNFYFISGKQELVFNFTAVSSPDIEASFFSLRVRLVKSNTAFSVRFPLLYPQLYPVAPICSLVCSNKTAPASCLLQAADEVGPVRLDLNHFRLAIFIFIGEMGDGEWVDNTSAFDIMSHPLSLPSTASITWRLKVNNITNWSRLQVYTTSSFMRGLKKNREVRGSPFVFLPGVRPNAAYMSLRSCRSSFVVSGSYTMCCADLYSGVAGNTRHYHLSSTLGARFEQIKYVATDSASHTVAISFLYIAPIVQNRSIDFITLRVNGRNSIQSPHRIDVLPLKMEERSDSDEAGGSQNAAIIALGLLFFGTIIVYGCLLVVKRSMQMNRISNERAIRNATREMTSESIRALNGQVVSDTVRQENSCREFKNS